jgi:hypothetical protein
MVRALSKYLEKVADQFRLNDPFMLETMDSLAEEIESLCSFKLQNFWHNVIETSQDDPMVEGFHFSFPRLPPNSYN